MLNAGSRQPNGDRYGKYLDGPGQWLNLAAPVRSFARVSFDVLRQMIRPHELPGAVRADELLLPGVRPLVPGQLVRPGELPAAAFELAREGLLTCNTIHIAISV